MPATAEKPAQIFSLTLADPLAVQSSAAFARALVSDKRQLKKNPRRDTRQAKTI